MTGSHTGNASRPRLFGPALTASADKSAHGEKAVAVAARVQLGYAHQGQETARATAKAEPGLGSPKEEQDAYCGRFDFCGCGFAGLVRQPAGHPDSGHQKCRNAPPAAACAAPAVATPATAKAPCTNPDALGISRVVEIDTTGGPGFGFEHFKQLDFLRDKEVVLTFDDGPWLVNTPSVLKSLANECTTGIFFPIGKHATYYPEILKQVLAAGHTVGSHTWSHATLTNKKLTEDQRKEEIEKGFSAVKWALGGVSPSPVLPASRRCSTRLKWSPISAPETSLCSPAISTRSISRRVTPSR